MRGDSCRFHCWRSGLAVLFLAGAAIADDPEVLFQRVKAHMSEHLAQLPKYTCHETIDRITRVGGNWRHRDTIEFDVAFAGDKELFSRPGMDHFEEQSLEQMAQGGTMSNRAMGSDIDLIFSLNVAEFQYAGAGKKDGRKALRFNLRVPVEKSHYCVRRAGLSAFTAYEGSVWVEPDTLDLVRVDFKANQIPSSIGVNLVEESLHYKKLTIGKSEFVLPDHSELCTLDAAGNYCLNMVKLDRCHEFVSDSVVTYGAPVGTAQERRDH
jgi:hypothetical protein